MFDIVFSIAITGILSLFLAWLFLSEYFQYRVDVLRYNLFVIRDSLFKYASEGNIGFDHPAYVRVRSIINALIYCAEKLSLLNIFLTRTATRKFGTEKNIQEFVERFKESLTELDDSQKNFIDQIMYKAHVHVFRFLIFTNPVLFPLALITDFLINHNARIKAIIRLIITGKTKEKWIRLDAMAEFQADNGEVYITKAA